MPGVEPFPSMDVHSLPTSISPTYPSSFKINGSSGLPADYYSQVNGNGNGRTSKPISASRTNGVPINPRNHTSDKKFSSSFTDEFFDAGDDSFSESGSEDDHSRLQNSVGKSPTVNRGIAMRLQEEHCKRIEVEEALAAEKKKNENLMAALRELGVTLPHTFDGISAVNITAVEGIDLKDDVVPNSEPLNVDGEMGPAGSGGEGEEIVDGVDDVDARMDVEAVAYRAASGAAEESLNQIVEQKDREIARLKDKLQFWECMHRELSNQTQESMELQRIQRKKWQIVQRVALGGLGVVLGIGLSAAAIYVLHPYQVTEQKEGMIMVEDVGAIGHGTSTEHDNRLQ